MTDASGPDMLSFGDFRLDLRDERLIGPSGLVPLGNKAFRVLAALAAEPRVLITKDRLFDTVWSDTIVTESALTSVVKELRRALGDDPKAARYIESVYGRGYRFIADVQPVPRAAPAPAVEPGAVTADQPRVGRRQILAGTAAVAGVVAVAAVWRPGGGGGSARDESVAIIPFASLNGASQQYFSGGLSDEIGVELASVPGLRVMSPSSVEFAVGQGGDQAEVARRLNVRYMLSGSVQRQGDALRIICKLVDVRNGYTVWTDRFEREARDAFSIQRDIARQVAAIVSIQTVPTASAVVGTANPAAYDAYLKGSRLTEDGAGEAAYKAAITQFQSALDLDPKFAQARAHLAMAHAATALHFANTPTKVATHLKTALALAREAAAQSPQLPFAQSALGYILIVATFDFESARPFLERGRQLGEGLAVNQAFYATFAAQSGRIGDARRALSRTLELDPLNSARRRIAVQISVLNGDYAAAIDHAAKALALSPRIAVVNGYLGDALVMLRRFAEARDAYRSESVEVLSWAGLAIAQHHLGARDDARRWLARLEAGYGATASYQQAQIWAQWGDPDRAAAALRSAWDVRDTGLTVLFRDPLLGPIRSFPIYNELVKRMRLV